MPVQATAIMALLQPSPEVFQLFDDVMLLSDGMCVFFGPREGVLPFFEAQGFKCPPRMPVPGFLQNITSRRDQRVSQTCLPAWQCSLQYLTCLDEQGSQGKAWQCSLRYLFMSR